MMTQYNDFLEELPSVLRKHLPLLETFAEESVFTIQKSKSGGFVIMELCDGYYRHSLTKGECVELSEMFREIAGEMEEA